MYCIICCLFKSLNIFLLFRFIVKLFYEILPFIFNKSNKFNFLKKYGDNSYALITGSSEGIGFGYAESLAKLGFNIILTGRNLSKLENSKKTILDNLKEKVDIKCIEIDFKDFEEIENFKKFMVELEGLDISILINNVAILRRMDYHKNKYEDLLNANNINCLPMTYLMREFIPKFQKRNKKCVIINISSVASKLISPISSTYSPCKLFNLYISESLNKLKDVKNVDFLVVRPGFVKTQMVQTNFEKVKDLEVFTSSVEDCVEGSLINLGFISNCNGSLFHSIFSNASELLLVYLKLLGLFDFYNNISKKLIK